MNTSHRLASSQGFTLIEVLIAVLVLAIGLLGLAGLQLTGLRNNQSAYYRSQATQLAYDMADRMRANPAGLKNGEYDNPAGVQTAACLTLAGCTASELAGNDAFEWSSILAEQLPLGVGVVCVDATPGDGVAATPACDGVGSVYAIKIWWDDDRSGAANQRFVTSLQP